MNIMNHIAWCCFFWAAPSATLAQQLKTYHNLKIGDTIPDVKMEHIWNHTSSSAKLSDFKGRLLILDFWATWCTPCVNLLPETNELQKKFRGRVQFIPVTYEQDSIVIPFLQKMQKVKKIKNELPIVTGDTTLQRLFPHFKLPHYVWIDPLGKVVAMTNDEAVNENNIDSVLKGTNISFKMKQDVKVDYSPKNPLLPVLSGDQYNNINRLNYYVALSGHIQNLQGQLSIQEDSISNKWRVLFCNSTLKWIYLYAFGEGRRFFQDQSTLLLVQDVSKLTTDLYNDAYKEWATKNTFCLELCTDLRRKKDGFAMLRKELEHLFPEYQAKIEKLKTKCLVLIKTGDLDKFRTKGGDPSLQQDKYGLIVKNLNLDNFLSDLSWKYFSQKPPTVNRTGHLSNLDMVIEADLSDISSVNSALKKYNLKFVEREEDVELLVIRDAK